MLDGLSNASRALSWLQIQKVRAPNKRATFLYVSKATRAASTLRKRAHSTKRRRDKGAESKRNKSWFLHGRTRAWIAAPSLVHHQLPRIEPLPDPIPAVRPHPMAIIMSICLLVWIYIYRERERERDALPRSRPSLLDPAVDTPRHADHAPSTSSRALSG
jgi:hypothetical protein